MASELLKVSPLSPTVNVVPVAGLILSTFSSLAIFVAPYLLFWLVN